MSSPSIQEINALFPPNTYSMKKKQDRPSEFNHHPRRNHRRPRHLRQHGAVFIAVNRHLHNTLFAYGDALSASIGMLRNIRQHAMP